MPSANYGSDLGGGGYVNDWWSSAPKAGTGGVNTSTTAAVDAPTTGRFSINIASPSGFVGSMEQNQQQANDFVAGLGETLFGEKTGLVPAPISNVVRWFSSLPGVGIPAAIPGHVANAASTVLSHIPTGWLPGGADQTFALLPDTPEKRLVEQAANADFLGGGNMKYDYVKKTVEAMRMAKPEAGPGALFPEFEPGIAGSAGGMLVQLLESLSVFSGQRLIERTIAGLSGRLDEVLRLPADELSPVEATAAQKVRSGEWSRDRALDYLSSHVSGLSHDPLTQIVGSALTDPSVIASLGSGLLTRAGKGAVSAMEAGQEASALGKVALAAQGSELGPLFKRARTVIDPLSAIGGKSKIGQQVVDTTTQQAVARLSAVGWGEGNLVGLRNVLDPAGLSEQVFGDASGALQNIAREHFGSALGDNLRLVGGPAFTPGATAQMIPAAEIEAGIKAFPKTGFNELAARVVRVAEINVDDADLAQRMAIAYGKTADDYKDMIGKLSPQAKSYLHLATYNTAENRLMTAIGKSTQIAKEMPLERMVLANPRHLNQIGAGELLKALKVAAKDGTRAEATKALKEALGKFDNLTSAIKYNPKDPIGSLERAIQKLDDLLANDDLPRLASKEEIAKYPELQAWWDAHRPWEIAFRPPDERLWRIVPDSEGKPALVNPWVGHAPNDGRSMYRPGFNLPRNLVGMPIVDPLARRLQKPLDWLEVGINSLGSQATGQMIRANSATRFKAQMGAVYGLTEDEAAEMWAKLESAAQMDGWSQSVRAMSGRDMWKAITKDENLIPMRLRSGPNRMTPRDFTLAVLDAMQGDLRFVGLTQDFTGYMKKKMATGPLAEFAGGNFAGQVSEKLYPTVRFLFHPMFQAQEAVEGIILNAQRGVKPFVWGKMSEKDKATARIMQNLQDKGVVRMFEMGDQNEYAAINQIGGRVEQAIADLPNSGITLSDTGTGLKFIARQKYINYLRLWRSQIGPEVREVLGEERFLALKGHYGVADDSEVVIRYLGEMMSESMDVALKQDGGFLDYLDNIRNAQTWTPMGLGSLHPLQLDTLARSLGYGHAGGLRAALTDGNITLDTITNHLRDAAWNASDEYVHRVSLALKFDLADFYSNVREAYKLTDAEYRTFRSAMEASAGLRGLSPVEYLSGVVAPQIKKVDTAGFAKSQEIKDTVALLRTGKGVKGSQADTLYAELAAAFKPHLDPSAVDVLRKVSGIKGKWGAKHNAWLGEQMRAFVDGTTEPRVFTGKAPDAWDVMKGYPASIDESIIEHAVDGPYVYHLTPDSNLTAIRSNGLLSAKPRGSDPAAVYFGGNYLDLAILVPSDQRRLSTVLLRTKKSGLTEETRLAPPFGLSEYTSKTAVPASRLEFLGADDVWRPVVSAPLDPDVERALQWMGRWTNDVGGLMTGSPEFKAIMAKTAKINLSSGVPYNYTEHLAWNAVIDRIKELEQDAHRVHYYKRARTVLERSVNHPFFGLYPASYMWGKILPELIRFIAQEPFGLRTGALAYASNDIYKTIAMQRELDPEFEKKMDEIGRSPAAFMLGYMLPAVPWDVPAVLPGWSRELADQGIANKIRREKGLPTKNIEGGKVISRIADYLSPLSADAEKINSLGKQIGDVTLGTKQEQAQRGGPQLAIPGTSVKLGGGEGPVADLEEVARDSLSDLQSLFVKQ